MQQFQELFSHQNWSKSSVFLTNCDSIFQVLSWKTLIVKLRHYVETILDILVPSFLFVILVVLRFEVTDLGPKPMDAQKFPNYDVFRTIFETNPDNFGLCGQTKSLFLYTPVTKAANDTIAKWDSTMQEFYRKWCPSGTDMNNSTVSKSCF